MTQRSSTITALVLLASAGVASAAEPGGSQASVFAGTIAQSIAAIFVFLLLFVLLSKFAWGPILKGLQDRENKIKSDLERAEAAARAATATLEEYRAKLAVAHNETRQIIEQGRADALKLAGQLKEAAQAEINGLRQRAENDIRGAKEQALAEIYAQTATLATEVASRILGRQINPQDQQQLIQESLTELSRTSRS